MGIAQQLVFHLEETAIDEIVVLDPGEGQRESGVFMAADEIVVHAQETGRAFPHAPGARGGQAGGFVVAGQTAMEGGNQVVAFDYRDRREEVFPRVRKQARAAFLVEPFQFPAAQHEDAAQHQFGHSLRMFLGIGQRQGGTPAAAEDLPTIDLQLFSQLLYVRDQVPGGVIDQVRMRG